MDLTYEDANSLLHYDHDTGELYWKMLGHHKLIIDKRDININDVKYSIHRIAWLLYYKKWPKNYVRHTNGNNLDNRICNLYEMNMKHIGHRKLRSTLGTSSYKGVTSVSGGKFRANCKNKHLGNFDTEEEAHQAYKRAARKAYGKHATFE